jgi:hypothetical protein
MTKQYGRIFKFYGLFGVSDSIHQSAVQRQVVQFTSIVSSGQASLCHRSPSATSYHRQGSRHIRASTHFYRVSLIRGPLWAISLELQARVSKFICGQGIFSTLGSVPFRVEDINIHRLLGDHHKKQRKMLNPSTWYPVLPRNIVLRSFAWLCSLLNRTHAQSSADILLHHKSGPFTGISRSSRQNLTFCVVGPRRAGYEGQGWPSRDWYVLLAVHQYSGIYWPSRVRLFARECRERDPIW